MKKRSLSLAALSALFFLGGCVPYAYPRLYTPPVPTADDPATLVDDILAGAAKSQEDYAIGYDHSARSVDESQLPLIAAAGLAALVVAQEPDSALDILTGIGVGVGVYSSARSTLQPTRLPELYLSGHSALGCIRAEGAYFVGNPAKAAHSALEAQTTAHVRALDEARGVYRAAVVGNADRAAFQAAMAGLNDAIIAGDQALAAARRQLAAHQRAESTFGGAVADVHIRVASLARAGRVQDFAQLRQSIAASIDAARPAAPTPGTAGVGTPAAGPENVKITVAPGIDEVVTATRTLLAATNLLILRTPDYLGSLTRVEACPERVR